MSDPHRPAVPPRAEGRPAEAIPQEAEGSSLATHRRAERMRTYVETRRPEARL